MSLWTSFGANLRLLGLGGNCLEGYRELIESEPCLKQLEELRVSFFMSNVFRIDQAADNAILVDIVAPFINSLNPHIKVLEICSWANLNISPFFKQLGVFSVLQHLKVRMAFNQALASDPSGLKQLLRENSETLEKLDLRLNPIVHPPAFHPAWLEGPLAQWLAHCIEDERCFANLRYLEIYPTDTPVGIDTLLTIIQRASRTLMHLTIRDRYLEPPEVSLILEAASRCPNLTHLTMNVRKLTVALLDSFAVQVPWVENLWLTVKSRESISREIQQRRYVDWKLKDLSVWLGDQHEADRETLEALARSIPSVTSFFGRGQKQLSPFHKIL